VLFRVFNIVLFVIVRHCFCPRDP